MKTKNNTKKEGCSVHRLVILFLKKIRPSFSKYCISFWNLLKVMFVFFHDLYSRFWSISNKFLFKKNTKEVSSFSDRDIEITGNNQRGNFIVRFGEKFQNLMGDFGYFLLFIFKLIIFLCERVYLLIRLFQLRRQRRYLLLQCVDLSHKLDDVTAKASILRESSKYLINSTKHNLKDNV